MAGDILLVLWNGGGNVNPTLALATKLAERGHRVHALGSAALRERFRAVDIEFVDREPADEWDLAATARDVRDAGRDAGVVVVDYMMPGAICGAETLGAPTIAFVHTLYAALLYDGAPAPISMAASLEGVNELRASLGLDAVERLADLLDHAADVLVCCPRVFDDPQGVIDRARYVGPLLEPAGADADWAPPAGDAPLVAVSLGTTPMDEAPVVQRVIDALGQLPVRGVVMLGDHLDADAFAVPKNVRVAGYVRHAAVLPYCSAMVTHAGLGTVMAALAQGVPLVCVPLGRDQPQNAATVERVGAGRALDPTADVDTLRDAIAEVADSPDYRVAAASVAEAIDAYGQGRDAVAAVEALLG